MKLHNIKLMSEYAEAKLKGVKPFEIRLNDRDYKIGDLVRYIVPDNENLDKRFAKMLFQIVYITNYQQKDDYIVFCDKYVDTLEITGE